MPKCVACDSDLIKGSEIVRGYCDTCQVHIRTVFDKDAFALGQYQRVEGEKQVNLLEWTNITESVLDSEQTYIETEDI